jgi:hypothetical protein
MSVRCCADFDTLPSTLEGVPNSISVKEGTDNSKIFCKPTVEKLEALRDLEKTASDVPVGDFCIWSVVSRTENDAAACKIFDSLL